MEEFTIFLAEDDEDDAYFFQKEVRAQHPKLPLLHFPHGHALMEYLQQGTLQIRGLIILDLVMAEMDGFQVLRQLRQSYWVDHLPVMVLSGSQAPKDIELAYQLGANAYLFKSDSPQELSRIITSSVAFAKNLMPQL